MRQTLDDSSNQQRQRNGNYSVFRTNGPLVFSSVGALCCLCVLIAGVAGLVYASSYFEPFVETNATIVGTNEMNEFEHSQEKLDPFHNDFDAAHCPIIHFFTVGEANPRNITTVLEFGCRENKEDIVMGESVDIRYNPSDPADVYDDYTPEIVEVAMILSISISAFCSCCCVVIGTILYKLIKAKKKESDAQDDTHTAHSYANNLSNPASVQMTNFNGNHTPHAGPNGYNSNEYNNPETDPFEAEPIETTLSAEFPAPAVPISSTAEAQPAALSPPIVPVYPEGTHTSTAIAAGDEVPPIVGCTLIPSNPTAVPPATPSIQTYTSPSNLPIDPPGSSYMSPSDIHDAAAARR
mmetsp:Transcript_8443/g.20312  ORF Transcript_8443/g.20312 Transcript_8443/m.20312 type:complete len:352 (+) Transcript_8443:200-1255(+)